MEENAILRVISGIARGHKLKTLEGDSIRPTSDRVKESLFNIIAGMVPGAVVLDLFAGTGSLGIEALSRGAEHAVFVDKSRECAAVIKDNLMHTKLFDKAEIITGEVSDALGRLTKSRMEFDLVFMDPPYGRGLVGETLEALAGRGILKEGCIVIAEHDRDDPVPEKVRQLELVRDRKYGNTKLSFYSVCRDST